MLSSTCNELKRNCRFENLKQADRETNIAPKSPPGCNHPGPLLHSLFYNHRDVIFHLVLAARSEKFLLSLAASSLSSPLHFLSRHVSADLRGDLCTYTCISFARTVLQHRPIHHRWFWVP
jgi:hypothetical protein